MLDGLLRLLFPPKCILCQRLLQNQETDLCKNCRQQVREFSYAKKKFSFIASWTALWYYEDTVRASLLRYKFLSFSSYAGAYGRLLAMRLLSDEMTDFDILTWVPISAKRKRNRGYDQVELLARAVGRELSVKPVRTLRKHRHAPPQSGIADAAARRANVLGAYTALNPQLLKGKRILLLDDIITTGATASECARTLLTAGAEEVIFAAIAVTEHKQNSR